MTPRGNRVESIPVSGGEIYAEIRVSNRTSPRGVILFLHGWTLDHRMWAPQLSTFGADYLCVAVDRRGFGRSSAPANLALESDDIATTLDFVGARRAVIVGMSQAARIAADFAIRFPERVAGLVLHGARIGARGDNTGGQEIPVARYAALAKSGRLAEMKAEWRAHPLMRTNNAAASSMIDEILRDYDARDLVGAASSALTVNVDALAVLRKPTLIVTGETDTLLRCKLADELSRTLPNATRAEIIGAGHLCNVCGADDYNSVLKEFLARVFPLRARSGPELL